MIIYLYLYYRIISLSLLLDDSYGDEYGYDYGGGAYDSHGVYQDEEPNYSEDDLPVYGGNNGYEYGSTDVYSGRKPSRGGYGRLRGGRRRYAASQYDDSYDNGYDNGYDSEYDDSYGIKDDYAEEDYGYAPRRSYGRRRNRMNRYGRSGTYGYSKPKKHIPVIIKKKKEKKRKSFLYY